MAWRSAVLRIPRSGVIMAVLGCVACGASSPVEAPHGAAALTLKAGGSQVGWAGEVLPHDIVVALHDGAGEPMAGAEIVFQPSEGSRGAATTDATGLARFGWRLGEEYDQTLVVSAPQVTAEVSVTAIARYRYRHPVADSNWPVGDPGELDVDTTTLMAMMDEIRRGAFPRIHSVLVARAGRLVLDEAFPLEGETAYTRSDSVLHYVASVSKVITSLLTGIALDRGLIDSVDEPLYGFFPEYESFENWSSEKAQITLDDALTMRAGLDCADDGSWESRTDYVKATLDLPMVAAPGTAWRYCSMLTHVIGSAVAGRAGENLADFAQEHLFGPMGISKIRWTFSPAGRAVTGYGFWMNPRDMLSVGQMVLDGGVWRGHRLVSEAWLREATTGRPVEGRTDQYGYQWWVQIVQTTDGHRYSIPFAAGDGGQMIFVMPDHDATVVFTGGNYGTSLAGLPVTLLERFVVPALRVRGAQASSTAAGGEP